MPVHSEVHVLADPLEKDGVPVLVIQEAAQGGRGGAAAEPRFAVICEGDGTRDGSVPKGSLKH